LAEVHADFGLLRDLAKAHKHVRLDRGKARVSNVAQTSVRSFGYGTARYGEARYGGPPQIAVETDNGELRVVEAIVRHALGFLCQEMQRLRIIQKS
jgi:hypothetical protein